MRNDTNNKQDVANLARRNEKAILKNFNETMSQASEVLYKTYIQINLFNKQLPLKYFLDEIEKKIILSTLKETRGSQKRASDILGVKQTTLCEKIKKFNLK